MLTWPLRANFSRGELSPKLHARADVEHYASGLASCKNFMVMRQGGLRRRPGTLFVRTAKTTTKPRLIPFIFSQAQAYQLEFGPNYIRFFTTTGIVLASTKTITAVATTNPAQITTSAAHGLSNGARVILTGIIGTSQLNNREFSITNVTATTFMLADPFTGTPINANGYDPYTSGGTVNVPYEVATPYAAADLFQLDFAQSADVLTIAHEKYAPRELTRIADNNWTLTLYDYQDGPFLPASASDVGAIKPSNRGTIGPGTASGGDAPTAVLDSSGRSSTIDTTSEGMTWAYALGTAQVCDNYYIQSPHRSADAGDAPRVADMPTSWAFQGLSSGSWTTLDVQDGLAWTPNETKFFKSGNKEPFTSYRFNFGGRFGGSSGNNLKQAVAEIGMHRYDQPISNITFTLSTNAQTKLGGGWNAARDVGRQFRMRDKAGKWNWLKIDAVTNASTATGRSFGQAFYNTDGTTSWRMGAWYLDNWPSTVAYYQQRRVFAGTAREPVTIWMTKNADYFDFGDNDPPQDDDGITLTIVSSRVSAIRWLVESGTDLQIGTDSGIRTLGPQSASQGFSGTNLRQTLQSENGTARIKPARVGSTTIFVDFYGKKLREFVYDLNSDVFVSPEVSIMSDHLFDSGIVSIAYQEAPDSTLWIATTSGSLVAFTYEREQKIVGLTDCSILGGLVRSVSAIPASHGTEIWMVVERSGVMFIERLAPIIDTYTDVAQARFLDCAFVYSGTPVSTVSGMSLLEGQSVKVLADGLVYENLTITNGKMTLPNLTTASTIVVGLPFVSSLKTLRAPSAQDGSLFGRRAATPVVNVDVLQSLGMEIRSGTNNWYSVFRRDENDPTNAQMLMRTGTYQTGVEPDWDNGAVVELRCNDPLPATLRALVIGSESEP